MIGVPNTRVGEEGLGWGEDSSRKPCRVGPVKAFMRRSKKIPQNAKSMAINLAYQTRPVWSQNMSIPIQQGDLMEDKECCEEDHDVHPTPPFRQDKFPPSMNSISTPHRGQWGFLSAHSRIQDWIYRTTRVGSGGAQEYQTNKRAPARMLAYQMEWMTTRCSDFRITFRVFFQTGRTNIFAIPT